MLYKQAWEELKYWVQEWNRWPEQKLYRTAESNIRDIQIKMKQLEKKVEDYSTEEEEIMNLKNKTDKELRDILDRKPDCGLAEEYDKLYMKIKHRIHQEIISRKNFMGLRRKGK